MLLAAALTSAPEVSGAPLRLRALARRGAVLFQSLASGLALPLMGANALGHYADQPPEASRPCQTPHSKLGHTIGPAADVTVDGGAFAAQPYLGCEPG
jgi:hypothetical protein